MHMSVFAYISLGMGTSVILLAYLLSPDAKLSLTLLPMVLLLGGIPMLMNVMNRRHVDRMDLRHVKLGKIKDLAKKAIGEQVRISGTVTAVSQQWLNRPNFQVVDPSGEIGVYMFVAPRDKIKGGDQIEVVGTLRWSFGFKKKNKKIWGLQMEKIPALS
ncbi:MAG: putative rane protein [Firmicutes bacterium]|nr:putative rane protein [Bacillota bacterium]